MSISASILDQMPGLIACIDLDTKFIYCNQLTADTFGFNSPDELVGLRMDQIRCKAAESAPQFSEQNTLVATHNRQIKTLDIHPFAFDKVKAMVFTKAPYQYDSTQMGVVAHGDEITRSELQKICYKLASTDKRFRKNNNVNQRSYKVSNNLDKSPLSSRELECIFYMIRGKSAREIADILCLSKRTIESYITHARIKLDCHNKSSLIEKAFESNLFDFVPETLLLKAFSGLSDIIS